MWRGWLTRRLVEFQSTESPLVRRPSSLERVTVSDCLERGSLFNCFTCATMRDNRGRIIQEEYQSVYRQYLQLPAQGFASWWHKV